MAEAGGKEGVAAGKLVVGMRDRVARFIEGGGGKARSKLPVMRGMNDILERCIRIL